MFSVNVFDLRNERQKHNNLMIAQELCSNSPSYSDLEKIANIKAVDRLLSELEIDYDNFLTACSDNIIYSKTVAVAIAKNATRQGKKDEAFVINGIANALKEYGFNIRSCGVNEYRPCKNGQMLSNTEFRKQKLNKDVDALKSVDGIFDGPKSGYLFAKIVIGGGGHQDNVLHEINQYIDWAKQYGESDKIYVMLIDGKEFVILKQKQTDNIWVVDHIEFQEKLIGN
jgi:hypothetical protein